MGEQHVQLTREINTYKFTSEDWQRMATSHVDVKVKRLNEELNRAQAPEAIKEITKELGRWVARQDLLRLGNEENNPNIALEDGTRIVRAKELLGGGVTEEQITQWAHLEINAMAGTTGESS